MTNNPVRSIAEAIAGHRTLPALPKGWSLEEGYAIARQVAAEMNSATGAGRLPGLKAGLTDPAVQGHLGLKEAVLGHLYPARCLKTGARLAHRDKALIECELAIRVDSQGQPLSVAPVLEFVRVDFARREDMTPGNLAAINLGADAYLLGDDVPWSESVLAALDDTVIRLYRNDEPLFEANAAGSLGGPRKALDWMLGRADKLGWALHGETVLITGTVGKALPFECGEYRVDYGGFGSMTFHIVPA